LGNIDEISIDPLVFSLAIIMSQDCDLKQDHDERGAAQNNLDESSNNRILPNVLLCPVVTDSELFGALPRGSDIKKRVVQNKDERYQYLRSVAPEEDARGKGLSALGIDFRRYFTVPTAELYAQLSNRTERRCRLNATYLEHLSSRFNAYLSRVALPRNHHEE
jgi:hypothetical protein